MTREDLIKQCRYYKGESESPWEGVDQDKDALWFYESCWTRTGEDPDMLSEYHHAGLPTDSFDIPISLQALLFNRFARGYQSPQEAAKDFTAFLSRYYAEAPAL